MLRSSADRQLYVSEFHTEGALSLTLNDFAVVLCTVSSSYSDDRNVRAGIGSHE